MRPLFRVISIVLLLAVATPGQALRFSIRPVAQFVFIQVGSGERSDYGLFGPPVDQVDVVSFPFPLGVQAGDGTPLLGTPVIPIAVMGYSGRNQSNFIVTMDSSGGLTSSSGGSMPFTDFSWTTQDGDIPGGQFDGSASQFLLQHAGRGNRGRAIVDYLTFSYANAAIYTGGSYSGRVTYTIAEL